MTLRNVFNKSLHEAGSDPARSLRMDSIRWNMIPPGPEAGDRFTSLAAVLPMPAFLNKRMSASFHFALNAADDTWFQKRLAPGWQACLHAGNKAAGLFLEHR